MRSFSTLSVAFVLALSSFAPSVARGQEPESKVAQVAFSAEESALAELIQQYRREHGLAEVPVSKSLSLVAQSHVLDLQTRGSGRARECNLHSWSDQGSWTPCCYTSDHKAAGCMWSKPRELTQGVYGSQGFEIAYATSGSASASGALNGWKRSSGHNEVILNRGIWASSTWRAMGVGIRGGYAVVWFGKLADPVSP